METDRKIALFVNPKERIVLLHAVEGLMDTYAQEGGFIEAAPGTIVSSDPEDLDFIYESLSTMFELRAALI
jgi:hypothetical protein